MKMLVALAVLLLSANAMAGTSHMCEARTASAFPDFEQAPGVDPRLAAGHQPGKDNSVARGDYDGDGTTDMALLLRPKSGTGKYAISVCLSSKPTALPELILDAYTPDALTTTPKGREYYDYNTETKARYELDGIGSYCCECCGATYIFREGRFVEIIDSD